MCALMLMLRISRLSMKMMKNFYLLKDVQYVGILNVKDTGNEIERKKVVLF